ncbi:MAG TPA: ROK family protein [Bryobacteraceae bacterium]
MDRNDCAIAIDLGGTKLASAIVDRLGKIGYRKKIATLRDEPRATIDQIEQAIRQAGEAAACAGKIGMVVPGIYFSDSGCVWAPNLWGDRKVPLRAELEKRLNMPIVIDSDRAGYVLGEQWMGIASGISDCVYLAVGTGIGAGIISGGHLVRGASDIAGAVGWFALNPERKERYKEVGCWEAESAGPALARHAGTVTAEEAIAAARNGDARAQNALREAARYLGLGIANIVSLLNPGMIILGGGLMQAADLFIDIIRETMEEWAQPVAARQVRIEISALGEDAGLLGAAHLALGI